MRRRWRTPILTHPITQDVSDRIEKEVADADLVRRLERRGWEVHGGNWRDRIDPSLLDDLAKFRSYRASSIRDLLRALRNKVRGWRGRG